MRNISSIKNFDQYSNRVKSKWKNDGFRSLYESIIPNEVLLALDDWKNNYEKDNFVLIGGLCMSFYLKPRYTEDIDIIFLSENDLPNNVYKFRKNRPHSFEHIKTGVEVEIITPELINVERNFFEIVFQNSIISDGIRVASPESLIALKLSRFSDSDRLDIKNLYKYCIENKIDIDLSKYKLSEIDIDRFNKVKEEYNDNLSENHQMLEIKNYLNNNHIKINVDSYEIWIFENKYGEPRFYFSKDLKSKIEKFNDFKFAISLSNTFQDNENLRVVESSTEYKSFNSFKKEEEILRNWLKSDNNINYLRNIWNQLNPNRKINK
jgi:predicted nucleotidyltransferase